MFQKARFSRRGSVGCGLGGCMLLFVCVVCACTVDAVRWAGPGWAQRGIGGPPVEAALPTVEGSAGAGPVTGEQIFKTLGCSACHSLLPEEQIVGPSLAGIAVRAATRQPNVTAEAYLQESILDPNAYVVEGFMRDLMPPIYAQRLSPAELEMLIAFLMTQ